MKGPRARLGLPLLAKELAEQAARKRTYVVRVAYASLLFFAAYILFYNTLRFVGASPMAVLGRGRQMFDILVGLQFAGVYLFGPALTCGVITQEKERASLQLLFLTRLGPWTILFEKLLSRLIPLVGFLMLSLPLLAFAYTLGGISPHYLAGGVWMLLVSAVQAAALGLACSSYYRTTAAAFVASYLFGAAMFFGPEVLCEWAVRGPLYLPVEARFPLFGARLFFSGNAGLGQSALVATLLHSVPILLSSGACLVLARVFLVRRAFAPPRNIMMNIFGRLDRLFQRMNENRWTKGIVLVGDAGVLVGDAGALPDDEPIAWRETTKRSLGRARYLVRLFLAIEVPLLVVCLFVVAVGSQHESDFLSNLVYFLWGLAVLMVAVQSASLIAREKSQQSLDVLCTVPLSSKEILRQKFRGVRRLIAVLLIPFFTLFGFQAWWRSENSWNGSYGYGPPFVPRDYLISSATTVAIYLPMVAWLSLWIGLKARSQGRAIIGALAAVVGWCVLPFLFCIAPVAYLSQQGENAALVLLTSPMIQIVINEHGGPPPKIFKTPLPLILNSLVYGAAMLTFRGKCLNNADRLLGRTDEPTGPPPGADKAADLVDRILNPEDSR